MWLKLAMMSIKELSVNEACWNRMSRRMGVQVAIRTFSVQSNFFFRSIDFPFVESTIKRNPIDISILIWTHCHKWLRGESMRPYPRNGTYQNDMRLGAPTMCWQRNPFHTLFMPISNFENWKIICHHHLGIHWTESNVDAHEIYESKIYVCWRELIAFATSWFFFFHELMARHAALWLRFFFFFFLHSCSFFFCVPFMFAISCFGVVFILSLHVSGDNDNAHLHKTTERTNERGTMIEY